MNKKETEWGFDLTHFGSESNFKGLLKDFGLKKYRKEKNVVHYDYGQSIGGSSHTWSKKKPYHAVYYKYNWSNPKLKITTGNNPITGAYSSPKQRDRERGYASYIGITGKKREVLRFKEAVKKKAHYYKDESPFKRDFI